MHRITDAQALAAVALAGDDLTKHAQVAAELDADDATHRAWLTRPEALAAAAAWYARNGLAVFPLRAGDKSPGLPKAHPEDDDLQRDCKRACGRDGHGLYDATTDLDRVTAWWRANPRYNIGLRTGLRFDVIDVDGPPGFRSLLDLALPTTLGRVITSRGGRHLYVAPSGRGNKTGLLPGIDYRGDGGFVVAPPSFCRTCKHCPERKKGVHLPVLCPIGRLWHWLQPLDVEALAVAA